jgi:hypothetical protein
MKKQKIFFVCFIYQIYSIFNGDSNGTIFMPTNILIYEIYGFKVSNDRIYLILPNMFFYDFHASKLRLPPLNDPQIGGVGKISDLRVHAMVPFDT